MNKCKHVKVCHSVNIGFALEKSKSRKPILVLWYKNCNCFKDSERFDLL